jgi:hypothetical protein
VNSSTLAREVARSDLLLGFDYRQEDILTTVSLVAASDLAHPVAATGHRSCGGEE